MEELDIIEIDEKPKRPKKRLKKTVITFIVLDVLAVVGLFLTYGPIGYFRNLLVTTAMSTMTHHYLARIFYNDEMIQQVLANNYVQSVEENTNTDDITFDNGEKTTYESVYEEQILKRDPNHPDYKMIDIEGTGYKGFLVAIYDPSKVKLAMTEYLGNTGELLRDIARKHEAQVAINASGFQDFNEVGNGGQPTGVVIKDGKIIWGDDVAGGIGGYGGGIAGFNKDHVLVLTRDKPSVAIANGMMDAVQFGPFLIVNGKSSIVKGNGGWGIGPRTVLAQRKDGIVLFLIIDGRQPGYSIGADMGEIIKILKRYKAHNAVNMDGGASTTLVVNNELYNRPCAYGETGERWLPNGWILK